MKKLIPLLFLVSLFTSLPAQKIIEYETDDNAVPFGYFGSSLEESSTMNIANSNPTGINTIATVANGRHEWI